jgi:hypothetical protein
MRECRACTWILAAFVLGAGCSSPTSESDSDEERFRESLAATSIAVADVAEEASERFVNPVSFLAAELKDNWVYHLAFEFTLKTGDTGTLTLDAQFTDNGRPIPVPSALNDNPVLNVDAQFAGTYKTQPLSLSADLVLRSPRSLAVELTGSGLAGFADLGATFGIESLTLDFNRFPPLPVGTVSLQIQQPDFGNWTGTATFSGTPVVHVVATNGSTTFDLRINLLTGEID